MRLYQLKRAAVPFFDTKFATAIYSLETWNKNSISMSALEELPEVYVSFGHKRSPSTTDICGWSSENGGNCHFNFTINVQDCSNKKYDLYNQSPSLREFMNKVQDLANSHFGSDNSIQLKA